MKMRMRKKAFTLIELLVVIAIIAILAAILFPVFAQAREKARQTMCLNNFKQIGLGIMQYVQDYDEFYPPSEVSTDGTGNFSTGYDWTYAINPYIKAGSASNPTGMIGGRNVQGYRGGVYGCPSALHPDQGAQYLVRLDIFPGWYGKGAPVDANTGSGPARSMASIPAPANSIGLFEAGACYTHYTDSNGNTIYVNTTNPYFLAGSNEAWAWYSGWAYKSGTFLGSGAHVPGVVDDCDNTAAGQDSGVQACNVLPRYRHSGNSNFLYLDGHAKNKRQGQDFWATEICMDNSNEPFWFGNNPGACPTN